MQYILYEVLAVVAMDTRNALDTDGTLDINKIIAGGLGRGGYEEKSFSD